jgi:hypothetical protein
MGDDRLRKFSDAFDLESLLHPCWAFEHPKKVVEDPDLTLGEKRAILSAWASDACAVEVAPQMRRNAAGELASWDDIIDALRLLDKQAGDYPKLCRRKPRWRRGGGNSSAGESGFHLS